MGKDVAVVDPDPGHHSRESSIVLEVSLFHYEAIVLDRGPLFHLQCVLKRLALVDLWQKTWNSSR